MRFSELNLISPILAAADAAGYTEPSPIQQQAIPPVLAGRDLLGCAAAAETAPARCARWC